MRRWLERMSGKLVGMVLIGLALIGGALMYYLQVYHFYIEVDGEAAELVYATEAGPQPLVVSDIEAIDATSSPLRFRACVDLSDPATFEAKAIPMDDPTPLNAPGWFDCFSAQAIGDALEAGEARAFLIQPDIAFGVDRVLALYPTGQAFIWHQANDDLEG